MQEIKILELFIGILIFVPLIRPFVKDLQALEGLALFPPLALLSAIALFPVYGFRPECLPLLILAGIINIHNFSGFVSLLKRERYDTSQYPSIGYTVTVMGFLIITAGTALYFAPVIDTVLTAEGITTVTVRHQARNAEFFLRIYGPPDEVYQPGLKKRPLLFLAPPMIGSVTAVDKVCAELEAQGFTVITYSRRNFDVPAVGEGGKKYGSSLITQFRLFQALTMGTAFEKPNTLGRGFEGERKEDILFLLSYINDTLDLGPLELITDKDTLFLAGYGSGGSAAVLIGESPELIKHNPQVKGLIAVESPFWSVYQAENRYPPPPPEEAVEWFRNLWSGIANGFLNLTPKKMIGIERILRPELPTLFLVSDRAVNPRHRERRYRPVVRTIQSPSSAALVTIEGAGILDYSDCPAKYPLYAAFFSGTKQALWKNNEFIEGTASLMTAFAALVLSADPQNTAEALPDLTPRTEYLENIHFESGGVWNLPRLGYILTP